MTDERLDDSELQSLRERAEAATPGPWKAFVSDSGMSRVSDARGKDIARIAERTWESESLANTHLIASAPALLAEVAASRAEAEAIREAAAALVRCHADYVATTPYQKFPCRIDEMTEREYKIAQVAMEYSGAFSFISEQVELLRAATDSPGATAAGRGRMMLHYLASPYNHESESVRDDRYQANVRALAHLLHSGKVAFSPIVHHHPVVCLRDLGRGWEFWRKVDTAFLRRCDVLVVLTLDGWRTSVGVAAEIEIAAALGIPVEYMEPV